MKQEKQFSKTTTEIQIIRSKDNLISSKATPARIGQRPDGTDGITAIGI